MSGVVSGETGDEAEVELLRAVIMLDWSGVDLTPKSTPYAEKLVEPKDSNAAPDQIYTI